MTLPCTTGAMVYGTPESVDVCYPAHGRLASRRWTIHVPRMDVSHPGDGRFEALRRTQKRSSESVSLRTENRHDGAMRHHSSKKSPWLPALFREWSKPPSKRESARIRKILGAYPYNTREAVFCWLWANHAEVTEARERWYVTWEGIAHIMREDGVKGWKGDLPTANAVRRVWGRVCREIEERKAAGKSV